MKQVLVALMVILAACGDADSSDSSPATADPVVTTVASPAPQLVANCGAVELPVTDEPQLPTEPLDAEAQLALAEATEAVGGEMEIFDRYDWFIADRDDDRLVLFGVAFDIDTAEVPYADAVLVRSDDAWRPEGWGQCHIVTIADSYGNAAWVLEAQPSAGVTSLSVLINERDCANGAPPTGREILPIIELTSDHVTITVLVEPIEGDANCLSNPWHPVTIELGEPLRDRRLYDGHTIPAVERVYPPVDDDFIHSDG